MFCPVLEFNEEKQTFAKIKKGNVDFFQSQNLEGHRPHSPAWPNEASPVSAPSTSRRPAAVERRQRGSGRSSVRHRGLVQQVTRLLSVLYCSPPWRYGLMHIYTLCCAHQVFVFCPTYPACAVELPCLYIYTGCPNRKKGSQFL